MQAIDALARVEDAQAPSTPGAFASFFGPDPFGLLCVVILTSLGTCTSCSGDRGRSTWGTSAIFKTGIFCDPHGCRCRCTESAQDTSSDDADSGDSCLYRRTGETGGAGIGDILKFFAVVYFHDEYGSGNLLYGRP